MGEAKVYKNSQVFQTVLKPPELYGISSFLKQKTAPSSKTVKACVRQTLVYKLNIAFINIVLDHKPFLGGQFYCYLCGVLSGYINVKPTKPEKLEKTDPAFISLPIHKIEPRNRKSVRQSLTRIRSEEFL
eukprot:TRINITY_DN8749_c0_g1_i1.p1 TRINITY_DN8749_c0_g1~~TRINITY_DN8749_c0_g1_i1.p1  ORF type:complete len:130 (+),score=18.13 TRINITY_DN8749_c0_g1_i1:200-589(+)